MTGESDHVHVNEKHPFLVSGCKVMDGFGSFLVSSRAFSIWSFQSGVMLEDKVRR